MRCCYSAGFLSLYSLPLLREQIGGVATPVGVGVRKQICKSPKVPSIPNKKTNAPQPIGERLFSGCVLIKSGSTL